VRVSMSLENKEKVSNEKEESISKQEEKEIKETIEVIKKKLEEQDKLSKEYLDLLQRTQAEFRNYKQRVERETQDIIFIEKAKILADFLSYRDTIVKAIEKEKHKETKESLSFMLTSYDIILKRQGLEKLDVLDKDFDYNFCDCLLKQEVEDKDNKVIAIIEDGFTLDKKLIKPAKVIVGINKKKGDEK